MNPHPKYLASLHLAALPTAVSCSRMFVRHMFRSWNVSEQLDTGELVVSELVTNAVKATGVTMPQPGWGDLEKVALIKVRLMAHGDGVAIQVWDTSFEPPDQPTVDVEDDAECGRGLFIVRSVARQMGYFYPRSGGKVVWAEVALEAPVVSLPRGSSKEQSIHLPQSDPELLQKLLTGVQGL